MYVGGTSLRWKWTLSLYTAYAHNAESLVTSRRCLSHQIIINLDWTMKSSQIESSVSLYCVYIRINLKLCSSGEKDTSGLEQVLSPLLCSSILHSHLNLTSLTL